MSIRIAVIGDLHLGRLLYGYDLTPHIRSTMYRFFDLCVSHKMHAAVVLGDVFDRPTPTEALRKIVVQWFNEFERAGINLYVLVGNHDAMSNPESPSALESLRVVDWNYIQIVSRPMRVAGRFLMVPFPSPGLYDTPDEWLVELASEQEGLRQASVAFTHLDVYGAVVGEQAFPYRGSDYQIPDVMLEDDFIDLIVGGHIHKPQKVGKVKLVGAAERLRFDEREDDRAFTILRGDRIDDTNALEVVDCPYSAEALDLRQVEVDASAWGNPSGVPSTQDVIDSIAAWDVKGAIIKVQPVIDHQSSVDWSAVESELHRQGALSVVVAPPILAQRIDPEDAAQVSEPKEAAKQFIASKIADKKERAKVGRMFKQLRERLADEGHG